MDFTFRSNISSLRALNQLSSHTSKLNKSYERLSSGLRINRASDDAAGLAIADQLRADRTVYLQGIRNANDFISLTNIAIDVLDSTTSIVSRVSELATQAANGTLSNTERASLDEEAQSLMTELSRMVSSAEFNDSDIFTPTSNSLTAQVGNSQISSLDLQVATSSTTSSQQSVGDGTFDSTVDIDGSLGRFAATGDIDNDGDLDIILAQQSTILQVKLGNSDGTFDLDEQPTSTGISYSVAVADLNGDNYDDIVAFTFSAAPAYEVFISNGDGSFQAGVTFTDAAFSENGALADFDGDGNLDVVYLEDTTEDVLVRLGDGTGSFATATTVLTDISAVEAYEKRAADIDGDGNMDIIIATDEGVSIALGNGDGTFNASTEVISEVVSGDTFTGLDIADIDGDGDLDILAGNSGNDKATIAYNDGNGTFSTVVSFTTNGDLGNGNRGFLDAADFDGDGDLEIFTRNRTSQTIEVYENNGDQTFTFDQSLSNMGEGNVIVQDIDGDGFVDVLGSGDRIAFGNGSTQTVTTSSNVSLLSLPTIDLTSQSSAQSAITTLEGVQTVIDDTRTEAASFGARVEVAARYLMTQSEVLSTAESRIRDADIAFEVAETVRLQILQNSAASVLASANQQSSLLLTLLE